MRRKSILLFICMICIFGSTHDLWAKDLSNRLGIGYTRQLSVDLPSITVQYYPKSNLGISMALGVDAQEDISKFGFMAKAYRIVFVEQHMNFYFGGGAGIFSQESPGFSAGSKAGDNESGFALSAYGGGEFFIPGLDSLGFSFEFGVGVVSLSSHVRFRTLGTHPIRAGIIFYL